MKKLLCFLQWLAFIAVVWAIFEFGFRVGRTSSVSPLTDAEYQQQDSVFVARIEQISRNGWVYIYSPKLREIARNTYERPAP